VGSIDEMSDAQIIEVVGMITPEGGDS